MRHRLPFFGFALIGVIAAAAPIFGSLVTTDLFVVSEDDPIVEDVYVTSRGGVVDGTIDGDLTIFTGNLTIDGEVTGDVQVFSSGTVRVNEGARIGGSLRGAAINITISGEVASDVFASGASIVIEDHGVVGRDVLAFGGVLRVEGMVNRDVRGRTARTVIDGVVGGDTDVATQKFELGSGSRIEGDVLYRSPVDASVATGAEISGTITRLPSQSNFVYSVILSLANIVGFLGFLLAGLAALVLLRGSGSRAAGAVLTQPIRSLLYGLVAVVVAPFAVVILAATLVGIPLAVLLALLIVAGFVVGPVPAMAALGNRIMIRRGGLLGAFVVGAILWRFGIWAIPVFGGVLYIVALVWGIGAWIVGFIDTRREDDVPLSLLPASMTASGGVPDGWTPPFAPGFGEPEIVDEEAADDSSELANEDTNDAGEGPDDGPTADVRAEVTDEPELHPEPQIDDAEFGVDDPETALAEPGSSSPEVRGGTTEVDPLETAETSEEEASRRRAEFEALLDGSAEDIAEEPSATPDPPGLDPELGLSDDWGLPNN